MYVCMHVCMYVYIGMPAKGLMDLFIGKGSVKMIVCMYYVCMCSMYVCML